MFNYFVSVFSKLRYLLLHIRGCVAGKDIVQVAVYLHQYKDHKIQVTHSVKNKDIFNKKAKKYCENYLIIVIPWMNCVKSN